MSFLDKFRPGDDPMEPASPPPFAVKDRVVIQSMNDAEDLDGQILNGQHGTVTAVWFTANTEDVFGPWVVKVHIDGDVDSMMFHADELVRETTAPAPAEPVKVTVSQPEDDPDAPVPFVPTDLCSLVGPEREQLGPVTRHDVGADPVDRAKERSFAAGIERDLKHLTDGFEKIRDAIREGRKSGPIAGTES